MIKLLGASALALALSMPAAQAAHRHGHSIRMAYRHDGHSVHHLAWRRTRSRHDVAYRYGMRDRSFGGSYAEGGWRDDEGYATRPTGFYSGGLGPKPRAWCGWYARQLVGRDPGPAFNLARNWAHWGHAASPGPGVMVVWPHHVGMITGRSSNGEWIVKSGNDGRGMVRERPRSIAGAIAFRAS
jgi:hypothetical protein